MKREDWPERLHRLVAESEGLAFAWGSHDCCLFAARAVEVQTGVDPAAELRGSYATDREALAIVGSRGGVRGIATAALGPEILPTMAQRGDVVMIDGAHGDTLGICLGARCVAPGISGLSFLPTAGAVAAWRVR